MARIPSISALAPLLLLLPFLLHSPQPSHATSVCRLESPLALHTSDASYAAEAMANLSEWRSLLLTRSHQLFHSRIAPEELTKHPEVLPVVQRDTEAVKAWASGWTMYQTFFPFVTCPPPQRLTYFGSERKDPAVYEDGGKWACGPFQENKCVVYSLGSALDYKFETALMNNTNCEVWTFDCTVDGASVHPQRHHFEKLCIGDQPPIRPDSANRDDIPKFRYSSLQDIMKRLGHTEVTYLKIDIEGSEFDVMEHWHESDINLPLQIGIELHEIGLTYRYTDTAAFMYHMAGLGYAVAFKEDNIHCNICTELLLLRVERRVCITGRHSWANPMLALNNGSFSTHHGNSANPHWKRAAHLRR